MDLAFTPLRTSSAARRALSSTRTRRRRGSSSPSSAGPASRSRRSSAAPGSASSRRRAARGGRPRAPARAALVDLVASSRSSPRTTRPRSPPARRAGRSRSGPLVPDLDTATRIAVVGGDTVWELEGAERELLATNDETPAARGRVRRRDRAARCAPPMCCPRCARARSRSLALEACRRRRARARAGVAYAPSDEQFGRRSARTRRLRTRSRRRSRSSSSPGPSRWWAAWCVAHDEPNAAVAAAAAKAIAADAAVTVVRARDPGARRHRLHLGARPAPPLQARALDPDLGGFRRRSCAPRSPHHLLDDPVDERGGA